MTLEEYKKVRHCIRISENYGVLADSSRTRDHQKAEKISDEVETAIQKFADSACSHEWRGWGKGMSKCNICEITRWNDLMGKDGKYKEAVK